LKESKKINRSDFDVKVLRAPNNPRRKIKVRLSSLIIPFWPIFQSSIVLIGEGKFRVTTFERDN